MATATVVDGVAVVAYVKGVAVDSEGRPVKGAPKQPKDTDPIEQPGALGGTTPEERMGRAIADALSGKTAKEAKAAKAARAESNDDEDKEERKGQRPDAPSLPTVGELEDHLAGLKTVADVKALQSGDERKGAQRLYEARIAELKDE